MDHPPTTTYKMEHLPARVMRTWIRMEPASGQASPGAVLSPLLRHHCCPCLQVHVLAPGRTGVFISNLTWRKSLSFCCQDDRKGSHVGQIGAWAWGAVEEGSAMEKRQLAHPRIESESVQLINQVIARMKVKTLQAQGFPHRLSPWSRAPALLKVGGPGWLFY